MNIIIIILYYFLSNIFTLIDSSNILVIAPTPSVSHTNSFQILSKNLARKGHNVDIISFSRLNEKIQGYNDIVIDELKRLSKDFNQAKNMKNVELCLRSLINLIDLPNCASLYNTKQLKELKNSTKKYDLLITEIFGSECFIPWGWHFNIPVVVLSTSLPFTWILDKFGLPDNPSYVPTAFTESNSNMRFYERIINTGNYFLSKILFKYWSEKASDKITREFFGSNIPNNLGLKTNLLLLNTHFSYNSAKSLPPNVIEIGGFHIEPPKALSQHLDSILKDDEKFKGTILFSLGSFISSETMQLKSLQEIMDAFSDIPYKIIWKADKKKFPKELKFPSNIYFESWLPQLDILCDPRIKLFISHGGMLSTQEAIYCGVPILGFPVFGDQLNNIHHVQKMGHGLKLNDLTKQELLEGLNKILNDTRYLHNARFISEKFKDRPMSAIDTAIYWIEYVIRHKGASHLEIYSRHLQWYQYYLLDIFAVCVLLPLLLFSSIVVLLLKRYYFLKLNKMKKEQLKIKNQ